MTSGSRGGASWIPAGVLVTALGALFIQGLLSGSNGLVVGLAALAGPLALLLMQVRVAGTASQSPRLLGGLLAASVVLGGLWAAAASQLGGYPVLAAVAVWLLPLALALIAFAVLALRGAVDEPLDVPAYCAAVAFGWASGFVAILYGISIWSGVLDHAQPAALALTVLSEALLRPTVTAAGACLMSMLILAPVLGRPVLPTGSKLRWATLLGTVATLACAVVAPMYLDLLNSAAVLAGCGLVLGALCGTTLARAGLARRDDTGSHEQPQAPGPADGPGPDPIASAPGTYASDSPVKSSPDTPTDAERDEGGREVELGGVVPPNLWSPPQVRSRDSRPPSPIGMVGAVLALMAGLLVWGWWDGVRVGTEPCAPSCGPRPGPPTDGKDQSFDAAGWRVLHSAAMQPTTAGAHEVRWDLEYRNYQDQEVAVQVDFEDSTEPTTVDELIRRVTLREAPGFHEVYQIPNAGLGVYPGTGSALEELQTKPGLMPTPTGFFIMGVAVGDRAVVGWARGPREIDSRYNIHHYDPAYSLAAVGLASLASGFELLDAAGQPIYGPDM